MARRIKNFRTTIRSMTFDELFAASRAPVKFENLIDCYLSAQKDNRVGVQSALPMREFAPLMANVTLMERESADQVTYRIAGENIANRLGFNPMGSNFLDLLAVDIRRSACATHEKIFSHPCGHYLVYENEYETGRRMISESLMLPMKKKRDAEVNLLLGYHSHHQSTGVLAPTNKTSLVVHHSTNEFVDIGFGIPD